LSFCDKKFLKNFSREKLRNQKKFDEKNLEEKISRNKLKKIDEKTFIFKTKKLG